MVLDRRLRNPFPNLSVMVVEFEVSYYPTTCLSLPVAPALNNL
jgi:hypothetical protein